jgi:hypothetical protein
VRFALVFLCACRFSWSTWQGAPPRTSNEIKLTLYAADDASKALARSALARDPLVTLIELDASVIEQAKSACGGATCQPALDAACSWSALQGAEYYAIASSYAGYRSDYECTQYDSDFFDKHDECVAGHEKNQATIASYTFDVYDVKTCKQVPALSHKTNVRAWGPEEQSRPEALAKLAARVPAKSEALPEQIMITAEGRVSAAAPDGFYALYRDGQYRGYVRLRGAATPAEEVRPMYVPLAPAPGDALVARGRRKFVDLAIDGAIGTLTYGGERHVAGGVGAHVRHYKLDGGFQYGFGVDLLVAGVASSSVALFTPEVGWGFPIAPGFVLSANLGLGLARSSQVLAATDAVVTAFEPHAIASGRVQTFLTTWFYVSADIGLVYTGTFDNWDGINQGEGRAMSIRAPLARVYAGFDL